MSNSSTTAPAGTGPAAGAPGAGQPSAEFTHRQILTILAGLFAEFNNSVEALMRSESAATSRENA